MRDVTHWKRGRRFEKSQLVEFERRKKKVDFRLLAEALQQVLHVVWGGWKSLHRKIVPLSPYVEEPLSSKVIKCFVLELRSRKCFSCFGIPMLSEHSYVIMNILCTFHIFMYGYVTIRGSTTSSRNMM